MASEGPEIEQLVRRLAECPGEFLAAADDSPDFIAIIFDGLRTFSQRGQPEQSNLLTRLRTMLPAQLELLGIVCWLLNHEWFHQHPPPTAHLAKLMTTDAFKRLVELVKPAAFVNDPDRREELARRTLQLLALVPRGETAAHSADRLTAIDSVERHRILKATAAAERRAREIREAMALKKAQESASRYSE